MNRFTLDRDWYQTALPITCTLKENTFDIIQVLRFFPGRRLTCLAELDGKLVIIKYFQSKEKAETEIIAHRRLQSLGLNLPTVVDCDLSEGSFAWLAFEYISDARSWDVLNAAERVRALERIVEIFASLHNASLYHIDPHLDNFLIRDDGVWLVDAASIKPKIIKAPLANLGLLLSQVYPTIKSSWSYFGLHYDRCCNRVFTASRKRFLHCAIQWHHTRRRKHYLRKIFRECSAYTCVKHSGVNQVSRRDLNLPANFHPEHLKVVRHFKQGNTATVWLAELGEQWVVVKRYNSKGLRHAWKQWFKASRARASWQNAHLLNFFEIPTPTPLLYRDERTGLFQRTSYFVSAYIEGQPAHDYIAESGVSESLLLSLKNLFDCMRWFNLCQTDLKASNIIIHNEHEPYLIDLDSIVHYSSYWLFNKRWNKSWQRWLANWQGNNRLIFEQTMY